MWRCEDVKMRRCEKMWEDVRRWEDEEKMGGWGEDVKMRRCEDEKMWRRCEDVKMWGCEDVKMRRCEDVRMWRWEDVRRCEKMWEDVKMRRRWEDEKMRRREDVKMRRCEDVRMWRWEDVKMRRCEDVRMWRWEDVRRCEKMWEDEKMRRRWEDEKMWSWEDVKMWRWEDVKMRRCFTDPHYWKNPALRRSREKVSLGFEMPVHCVKEVGFHLVFYFFRKKTERFLLLDAIWAYFTFWKVFGGQTRLRYSHMSSNPVCQSLQQLKRHHYLRVSLTDRCNLKCQLAASRCEAFQSSEYWIGKVYMSLIEIPTLGLLMLFVRVKAIFH